MSPRSITLPWSTQEVQTFLGIIGEERVQRELDGMVRNEKVFQHVSERMAVEGYQRTSEQCRIKCKKLRSDYRKVKDHNSRSGVHRKNWKWLEMMDAIYGHRPASLGREGGIDTATSLLESMMEPPAVQMKWQGDVTSPFPTPGTSVTCVTETFPFVVTTSYVVTTNGVPSLITPPQLSSSALRKSEIPVVRLAGTKDSYLTQEYQGPEGGVPHRRQCQKAMYFLHQLKKINLSQELLIQVYSAVTESSALLELSGSAQLSDLRRLQRIVC
ncbi:unnamed protein product [Leuciscus chuanchicus]